MTALPPIGFANVTPISWRDDKLSTRKLTELAANYKKYIDPAELSPSKATYEGRELKAMTVEGKVIKNRKGDLKCIPLPDTLERRVIWLAGMYIEQSTREIYRPSKMPDGQPGYSRKDQEKYAMELFAARLLPKIPGSDLIGRIDHQHQGIGLDCFSYALSDNTAYRLVLEGKGPISLEEMRAAAFSQDPTPMLDKLGYELVKNNAAKVNDLIVYFQFPMLHEDKEFVTKPVHYAKVVEIKNDEIFAVSKLYKTPYILRHRIDCIPVAHGNRYLLYRLKEKS